MENSRRCSRRMRWSILCPDLGTRWGIMDEITLGGRVEFVTWIRVMDEII